MTRLALPALTLFLSAAVFAQPEKNPPVPAPAPAAATPAPAPIPAEAKAIFDRAIAAYRGARSYKETVDTRAVQKFTGMPQGAIPEAPTNTATLKWAGPARFAYTTQSASIYRDGDLLTVYIPGIYAYTQGPVGEADATTAAAVGMLEKSTVPQLLTGKLAGQVFPGVTSVKAVKPEEFEGKKGKRVFAVGESPIPFIDGPLDLSIWFADDTGLIGQTVYDLTPIMQQRIDNTPAEPVEQGKPAPAKPKAEKVTITLSWRNVALNPELPPATFVFTPRPADKKVKSFDAVGTEPAAPAPAGPDRK